LRIPGVDDTFDIREQRVKLLARTIGEVTSSGWRSQDMKQLITRFIKEEEGQDLIEYALLAALIALAAITAMTNLGGAINTKFSNVSTSLGNAS
jgi:pilus assembly protein Flp/PilA